MEPNFFSRNLRKKPFRIATFIYGLVFFNIGAVLLYEKFTKGGFSFDSEVRYGLVFLAMGLFALVALARSRNP
ncbi:hypothetical protein DESUT3_30880 [Desulfuromonas versatilis]|uniref:Uncharacterized protein n=1 Tax=Desulfuromonas versatilis TaxID=2802975 RepID=A0ABM8HY33_9BACT|nr:hypothetical protein [Desulfuromonas versatilis]BCR06019.1 hypothetical protein DESUT3_30880 [Desulfuromonas versatilis]